MNFKTKINSWLKNSFFIPPQVKVNWSCADRINLKVKRVTDIKESKISDIESTEDILTLEFFEAVENRWKTEIKIIWLWQTLNFQKIFYTCKSCFFLSLRIDKNKRSMSYGNGIICFASTNQQSAFQPIVCSKIFRAL